MEIVETTSVKQQTVNVGLWNCEMADSQDACIVLTEKPVLLRLKPTPLLSSSANVSPFSYILIDFPDKITEKKAITKKIDNNLSLENHSMLLLKSEFLQLELPWIPSHALMPFNASWCPMGSQIFAILSNIGTVTLWNGISGEMLYDMTDLIRNLYIKDPITLNNDNIPVLKEICNSLFVTAICWNEKMFQNDVETYTFFTTAHKNGNILIWKVIIFNSWKIDLKIELIHELQTDFCNISTILWIDKIDSVYLVYGNLSGKIQCTILNISTLNSFCVKASTYLCSDVDRLKVDKIVNIKKDDLDFLYFIIIKANFVNIIVSDLKCNILQNYVEDLGNIKITGIKIKTDENLIISTWTGVIFNVKLEFDSSKKPEVDLKTISTNINFNDLCLEGFTTSKNDMFCILCLKLRKNHVAKSEKLVSKISFAYFKDLNLMDILEKNQSLSLTNYWDCLEYFRIVYEKSEHSNNWPLLTDEMNLYEMNKYEMKLYLWCNIIKQKSSSILIKNDLFYLLLFRHVIGSLKNYVENFNTNSPYTNFQLKTIQLYILFLQNCDIQISHHSDKILSSALNLFQNMLPNIERKCWCNEDIKLVLCSKNHPRQWCCITLQDIDEVDCLMCPICESVAHPELAVDKPKCTFCDVYMEKLV